jgi:hypothetical protein
LIRLGRVTVIIKPSSEISMLPGGAGWKSVEGKFGKIGSAQGKRTAGPRPCANIRRNIGPISPVI